MAKEVVLEDLWSSHDLSNFIWGCDTKHAFEIFIAWFWSLLYFQWIFQDATIGAGNHLGLFMLLNMNPQHLFSWMLESGSSFICPPSLRESLTRGYLSFLVELHL